MEAEERREKLLKILREKNRPVPGNRLAEDLRVSRQVIVQDIALLRAGGADIFATPQGYIMTASLKARPRKILACQHNSRGIAEELETIILLGGKVLDVIVEHPLYGELKGNLMLAQQADLVEYLEKYHNSGAEPLSALTKGVHLHTVEAEDEQHLEQICEALKKKGFLLSQV